VEELQNDKRVQGEQIDDMGQELERLREQNAKLVKMHKEEKEKREVLEAKLMKQAINHEVQQNARAIVENTFFEEQRNKLARVNETLLSTVRKAVYWLDKQPIQRVEEELRSEQDGSFLAQPSEGEEAREGKGRVLQTDLMIHSLLKWRL